MITTYFRKNAERIAHSD